MSEADLERYPYPEALEIALLWPRVDRDWRARLEAELKAEVGPGHPLFGVPVRVLGAAMGTDDVLVAVGRSEGPVLAEVHLTWNLKPEPYEDVPSVRFFRNTEELIEHARRWLGEG